MAKTIFITILFFLVLLLHLSQRVRARVSPPGHEQNHSLNGEMFSRPMDIIIVAVVSILVFIGLYFIFLCCCINDHFINFLRRLRPSNNLVSSFRHSFKTSYGLDIAVVKNFPTFEYKSVKLAMIEKGTVECAVCLMEFNDDDNLRMLPKCDHVFHADCIDDWLISHATCPICRLNLANAALWDDDHHSSSSRDDVEIEEQLQGEGMSSRTSTGRMTKSSSSFSLSSLSPRMLGRLTRSLSTGHMERFTLRYSAKAGYREGVGEGSRRLTP